MRIIAAGFASSVLLAGCVSTSQTDSSVWCKTEHPERPTVSEYATYSERQKKDMRIHNTRGEKDCGWKS